SRDGLLRGPRQPAPAASPRRVLHRTAAAAARRDGCAGARDRAGRQGRTAMSNARLLEGKAAVITGAAAGIGAATAARFASDGARLVLTDVDGEGLAATAQRLREAGANVVEVVGDVADEAHCEKAVARCVEAYGVIDVLVANAGVVVPGSILDLSVEEWDRIHAIDARGMFLSCRAAIARMKDRGGSIVCLSSISGLAGQERQAAYGPAKFVASGLAKHLAVEWAH